MIAVTCDDLSHCCSSSPWGYCGRRAGNGRDCPGGRGPNASLPARGAPSRANPSFGVADLLRPGQSHDERDAALDEAVAALRKPSREPGGVPDNTLADTGPAFRNPDNRAGQPDAAAAANVGRWLALGLLAGGANAACVYVGSRSSFRRRIAFATTACR